MINGSPKLGKSNSGMNLKALEAKLGGGNEITHYELNKKPLSEAQYRELCGMDVLVLAFPLYIDAIPSHLFRMLVALEPHMKTERQKEITVYAVVNNGFYEGRQNHIALDIVKNWCVRSGLRFGQGIGQGAGEMMSSVANVPPGHGPLKNYVNALDSLARNILNRSTGETILFSPNFPRIAWRMTGTHNMWNATAKKNGLKKKDILRKIGGA